MLTPAEYFKLNPETQRVFINSLSPANLISFCEQLQRYIKSASKQADVFAIFGSSATTTDNVRFNLQMLKKSKEDTLVDVIARNPELKQCAPVMEVVREDFARVLRGRSEKRRYY